MVLESSRKRHGVWTAHRVRSRTPSKVLSCEFMHAVAQRSLSVHTRLLSVCSGIQRPCGRASQNPRKRRGRLTAFRYFANNYTTALYTHVRTRKHDPSEPIRVYAARADQRPVRNDQQGYG